MQPEKIAGMQNTHSYIHPDPEKHGLLHKTFHFTQGFLKVQALSEELLCFLQQQGNRSPVEQGFFHTRNL